MKTFITGGTGLLGFNIVQGLLKKEHQVSALVRSIDKGKEILNPEVELIKGEIQNADLFAHSLKGMNVLIHAAACYTEYYAKENQRLPYDINVKGTMTLFETAYQHGIKNVVYVSSAGVLESKPNQPINESGSYAEEAEDSYFKSKIEAEKEVLKFLESHPDMRIVLILPTVMLGPGDRAPTPTGNFLLNIMNLRVESSPCHAGLDPVSSLRNILKLHKIPCQAPNDTTFVSYCL